MNPPPNQKQPYASINLPPFVLSTPDIQLFSETAEKYASKFQANNKSTQMRKFYEEICRFHMQVEMAEKKEEKLQELLPFIHMINARAAYAKSRNLVCDGFVAFIKAGLTQIKTAKELKHFKLFFEAIIGFCPK